MRTNRKQSSAFDPDAHKHPGDIEEPTFSVDDKLKVLETIGREDLIGVFKNWQPNQTKARRKGIPLDQRVTITVTNQEKVDLQHDLAETNRIGEKVSISQFIRNRAIGSVDIQAWAQAAESELYEITGIYNSRSELKQEERKYMALLDQEDDYEEIGVYERKVAEIHRKLRKIVAQNENRKNRLSGRLTMAEAETVKWRASRLSLSTSDYLRFMIFDRTPASSADSHLSLEAKQRFYVSIMEVAKNGWGTPPSIAHCTQCTNYLEIIGKLKDQVKQLQTFA